MKQLKNLVISSGGITGVGFIGILKYLNELKLLDNVEKYVGTSIGSTICLALSIGYTWKQLYDFCYRFDVSKLIGDVTLDNFLQNYDNFFYQLSI